MMKKSKVKMTNTAVKKTVVKKAPVKAEPTPKKAAPKKAAPVKPEPTLKKAAPKKAAPVKPEPAPKKAAAKKAAPVKAEPAPKKATPKKAAPVKPAPAPRKAVVKAVEEHHEKAFRFKHIKLSKSKKKMYRDELLALRHEFAEQLQFHREDALNSKKDSAGERAGMATHMADLGSDNFRHDLELGLLSDEGDVIDMIDEALMRLEADEFGICLDCGKEIPEGRLEAKPYARYCTACKSRREAMEDPHRRHR